MALIFLARAHALAHERKRAPGLAQTLMSESVSVSVQFSLTVYVTDSALKAEQIRPSRCRSFGLEFKFSIY